MGKTCEEEQKSSDVRRVKKHDVVIVGARFAGVSAAKCLGKVGVEVLLLDQNSYHQFQPILYQVAPPRLASQRLPVPCLRFLAASVSK